MCVWNEENPVYLFMRIYFTILFIQQLKWHKVVNIVLKNKLATEPFQRIPKPDDGLLTENQSF